jgi:hypothetical protein
MTIPRTAALLCMLAVAAASGSGAATKSSIPYAEAEPILAALR